MATDSANDNPHFIASSHHRTWSEMPHSWFKHSGEHMHSKSRSHRAARALQHAIFNHPFRTDEFLLSRLKHEHDVASQFVSVRMQEMCRTD